jgi:hypothetical protein
VLGSLYQALVAAGAPPELARQAAEEAAGGFGRWRGLQRDLIVLKWMLALVIGLALGVLYMQWQALYIIDQIEAQLTLMQHSLASIVNS